MKLYYAIAFASLMTACSQEKKSDLQSKRDELTELKSQQTALNAKIKTLETDLTKLDPTKNEESRAKDVTVAPLSATTFRHFVELQGTIDFVLWVLAPPSSSAVTFSCVTVFTTLGPVTNM